MNEIVLGDVTVSRVEEMHGPVGMTPDQFFPGSPDQHWDEQRQMLVPDHLDPVDNIVQVAMQTWALRSEGRIILVDTGIGNGKTRPAVEAWDHLDLGYLANLAAAGIAPEDVNLVINTHLHVDHVGWNTRLVDGQWVPTFPNATYLMPRADYEHWNPANNPNITGGVNENVFEDSVAPVHAAGQVQLWETEYVVDANLTLRAAPGHTPGSSVLVLTSGSDKALFAGDLVHTPLQIAHPEHNSCFCEDPAAARATRLRLLGWAADHTALVLPAHFSGHSALEIVRDASTFAIKNWAPLPAY
ncbi:MBL fold metallo-hydrolase [Nocardia lijiangensis]|uniref:MBL fold metallo-hydrolase n=1 Tax=Nocardia lijiangensis TaxID=299618 RepID=UPI00082F3AAD|nr:MBL fold metallo-hydrolase [Nocardia lijiangensis]